ncbi:MAG: HD domain-containing protein, partial [Lachnospiraceae bacterium]|nr:HD domain-containing protein [Lachnospiraceae bacterium]
PDELIDKVNLLNNEEEKIYQSHTLTGEKILSEVKEYSYLAEVSHFHHERYDGGGYPDKLKGEEIPELARLVAVADAYDNLTSNNEFGEVAPQFAVREEFVKEGGIRFDPDFAKAMVALICADSEYRLREIEDETESVWKTEINCTSYRSEISNGIIVSENIKKITFKYESNTEDPNAFSQPSLIVYDSLDSRVHSTKQSIINSNYTEYGEIWFDGHTICTVARNIESKITDVAESGIFKKKDHSIQYEIETARYKDHIRIIIKGGEKIVEITVALPDSIRFAYIGITGENAHISGISVEETQEQLKEGDIKRIAEEVSYIDRMESDIANIQVNGYRTLSTEGVKIFDGMRLEFHTMSLPTANLIWHCPYMVLYTADDKKINGENYRELVLIRIDGEVEPADDLVDRNKILVTKSNEFEGWDNWKEVNKTGMECVVRFNKRGNKLTVTTDNLGISIKSVLTIDKDMGDIYVSLTGDQVALTDIRVL